MEPQQPEDQPQPVDEGESTEKQEQELGEGQAESSSSWWGGYSSWVNKAASSMSTVVESAKQKSNEVYGAVAKEIQDVSSQATSMTSDVYGLVAKDLGEVSTQAGSMVRSSSMTLKKTFEKLDEKSDEIADQALESVKSTVSSAFRFAAGYATQMFIEEDLEAEPVLVTDQEPIFLSRLQAQLYALANDPNTFLTDPHADDLAEFNAWACDLEKRNGEISDLIANNAQVRKNFSELVPEKVTHKQFWTRYFFKVHLIELQENKRQALRKRAAEAAAKGEEEEINWDDVADLAGSAADATGADDIPAELQEKLLKEYEEELKGASVAEKSIQQELGLKGKQISPEKEETSSDGWEKLSSGERSPKKQSKEEDEEWVQP